MFGPEQLTATGTVSSVTLTVCTPVSLLRLFAFTVSGLIELYIVLWVMGRSRIQLRNESRDEYEVTL